MKKILSIFISFLMIIPSVSFAEELEGPLAEFPEIIVDGYLIDYKKLYEGDRFKTDFPGGFIDLLDLSVLKSHLDGEKKSCDDKLKVREELCEKTIKTVQDRCAEDMKKKNAEIQKLIDDAHKLEGDLEDQKALYEEKIKMQKYYLAGSGVVILSLSAALVFK